MPAKLLIKTNDNAVPDSAGKWLRGEIVSVLEEAAPLGSGELDIARFFRFTITDKTVDEVRFYVDDWNRLIDMNVIQGPDVNGLRRINVRNNLVNASGDMGEWTVAATDDIIAAWNADHPLANLITIDIHQGTNPGDTWQCEGTFTTGEAQEFNDTNIEAGFQDLLKNRIWYITEAGMVNIASSGGVQSGTSAQLGTIVRDGLLD